MTRLTVRGIDPHLHDALKREAQRRGQSVNKYVLDLLRQSLGLDASPAHRTYDDLDHLAGTWTAEQAETFDAHLRHQRQIDSADILRKSPCATSNNRFSP